MSHQQSAHPEKRDEFLNALANHHCRAVVSYYRDSPEDVASVKDLANAITKQDHGGIEQVTLRLQHSILPKLATAGVVEYDAMSNIARYRGSSELEALMDCIAEL